MWDSGNSECKVTDVLQCKPKQFEPKSYTLIFEPSSTLTSADWNNATLTVYNNYRSFTFEPYGKKRPCDEDLRQFTQGGLTVNMEKPHPEEYYVEKTGGDENGVELTVRAKDMCTGGPSANPPEDIYVEFYYPYAEYTGWYGADEVITVPPVLGADIKTTERAVDDGGFRRSRAFISSVEVTSSHGTCDYLLSNLWIIIIAYLVIMGYRYFGERASDFKDMWDEFQGKK